MGLFWGKKPEPVVPDDLDEIFKVWLKPPKGVRDADRFRFECAQKAYPLGKALYDKEQIEGDRADLWICCSYDLVERYAEGIGCEQSWEDSFRVLSELIKCNYQLGIKDKVGGRAMLIYHHATERMGNYRMEGLGCEKDYHSAKFFYMLSHDTAEFVGREAEKPRLKKLADDAMEQELKQYEVEDED